MGVKKIMTKEQAYQIIGRTNSCEPFLSNMIKALQIASFFNTVEDNERLEAAKIVKKDIASKKRNAARKAKDDVYSSLGLTKVKGAVSGKTYWE
jgi:hypothetical protein